MAMITVPLRVPSSPRFSLLLLLLLLLRPLPRASARLTESGRPNGQTVAPAGADFLHYTLSRVGHRGGKRLRAKSSPSSLTSSSSSSSLSSPSSISHSSSSSSKRFASRRRPHHTLSSSSPFYTLRDSACLGAPAAAVRDDSGYLGLVRTITARDLAVLRGASAAVHAFASSAVSVFAYSSSLRKPHSKYQYEFHHQPHQHLLTQAPLYILFHGGPHCEWSRQFWVDWINATRQLRANCLVAIDASSDPMMNYNLMVLGFPSVLRLRANDSVDVFRGNRTLHNLITWIVNTGGAAPLGEQTVSFKTELDDDGNRYISNATSRLKDDAVWLEVSDLVDQDHGRNELESDEVWKGPVLDLRQETIERTAQYNWPLLGANVVCLAHIIRLTFSAVLAVRRKRQARVPVDPLEHAHTD